MTHSEEFAARHRHWHLKRPHGFLPEYHVNGPRTETASDAPAYAVMKYEEAPVMWATCQDPSEPVYGPTWREQIELAAYFRWESRGKQHGHDIEDWLAAEGEFYGGGK